MITVYDSRMTYIMISLLTFHNFLLGVLILQTMNTETVINIQHGYG